MMNLPKTTKLDLRNLPFAIPVIEERREPIISSFITGDDGIKTAVSSGSIRIVTELGLCCPRCRGVVLDDVCTECKQATKGRP